MDIESPIGRGVPVSAEWVLKYVIQYTNVQFWQEVDKKSKFNTQHFNFWENTTATMLAC